MEAPGCHPGVTIYSAHIQLNDDLTALFPYLNAVAESPVFFSIPPYIQFKLNGRRCALYADHLVAGGFENKNQALLFFDDFSEFINDVISKKNTITPDHRRYRPIPVMEIFKHLPRSNCRDCGMPTCLAFAAALSKGEILMNRCSFLQDPESRAVREVEKLFT